MLVLATAQVVIVQLIHSNPFYTNVFVGDWPVFNTLLLAYAVPAAFAFFLAYRFRNDTPVWPAAVAAMLGFALVFFYITAEVRHAFTKFAGNLGTSGSVAFLFSKRGEIYFEPESVDEEKLMEVALEAGAEDVEEIDGGGFLVITNPDKQFAVMPGISHASLQMKNFQIIFHLIERFFGQPDPVCKA